MTALCDDPRVLGSWNLLRCCASETRDMVDVSGGRQELMAIRAGRLNDNYRNIIFLDKIITSYISVQRNVYALCKQCCVRVADGRTGGNN